MDRAGDWSIATIRFLLRNPALALVVTSITLFAMVQIPTARFYGDFGVRPTDVGLNSIDVFLESSAILLAFTVVVSALIALLAVASVAIATGCYAFLVGRAVRRRPKGHVRQQVRRVLRLGSLLIPLLVVVYGTWIMIQNADWSAEEVWDGKPFENSIFPWRADWVEARWKGPEHPVKLSPCHLYYLGEGSTHVILYDQWRDQTFEIDPKQVQLEFPGACHRRGERLRAIEARRVKRAKLPTRSQ